MLVLGLVTGVVAPSLRAVTAQEDPAAENSGRRRGPPGGGAPGGQGGGFGGPPRSMVVVQGATVHTGDGKVIENAVVVVRGDKIVSVGPAGAEIPSRGVRIVDGTGKHLYPGLIDADSELLVDPAEFRTGQARIDASVIDAVDPLQDDARRSALAQGVTTVNVVPHGRGMFDGSGVMLKLKDSASAKDLVLESKSRFLGARLSGGLASGRIREYAQMRQQLRGAKDYADAWDEYAEKLEEYVKELEKLRKESGAADEAKKPEESKEGAKPEEQKPDAPPAEGEGRGRRRPGGGPPGPPGAAAEAAEFQDFLHQLFGEAVLDQADLDALVQQRGRRGPPQGGPGGPPQGTAQGGAPAAEGDGPKKPQAPQKNPLFDALREVLEGKVTLFVSVDDAADILNLLDLQAEFHFRCVLSGGAEVAKVLEDLEHAGLPLVYEMNSGSLGAEDSNLAALASTELPLAFTWRDGRAGGGRYLSLAAANAVSAGMDPEAALAALTSQAAKLLGVGDRIGTIAADHDADLVLCSGPPLSTGSRVELVMIDGQVVYER